jgi:hypothetical protein
MKTIKHLGLNLLFAFGLACALTGSAGAAASQVAKPAFDPASGAAFDGSLKVKATTSTSGAKVRYTTNGSQPTSSSPEVPSGGVSITATTTIKARAFKSGMRDSDVAEATYRKLEPVAKPSLSPSDGTEFDANLTVRASTTTSGATLRYTTNGSDPTSGSTTFPANGLSLDRTTTVKVRGFKSGMKDSEVVGATYRKLERVAKPVLSPADGTQFDDKLTIRASTATSGATLRYTTNGSDPTAGSTTFPANGLSLDRTTTVKVRAFKSGMKDSEVVGATYRKLERVAKPVLSPADGTQFDDKLTVRASTTTSGATLRYTTNGSDPTTNSPALPSSTAFPGSELRLDRTTTVKVRGFKLGMKDSEVTGATFTCKLKPPVFTPANGTYFDNTQRVAAASLAAGVTIRYTTNGTTPSASSQEMPSSGIVIATNTTFRARAFRAGASDSDVATAAYNRSPRVVLLLHGMNTSPWAAWDSPGRLLYDSKFFSITVIPGTTPVILRKENVATIYGGRIKDDKASDAAKDGVFYYCVKFGSSDSGTGLEPDCKAGADGKTSGDFTSFNGLGEEVRQAIKCIKAYHAEPRIVLAGHSRGGIAGRAFLQANSVERASVVGFVTTGTPHTGSPFGRLYNYLDQNRTNEEGLKDWDFVKNRIVKWFIDLRRPVIGQFSPESPEMDALARTAKELPASVKYATLSYNSATFGDVGYAENVFTGWGITSSFKFTASASNAVHKSVSPQSYLGDGIVPATNQTFTSPGVQVTNLVKTDRVLHTEQTKRIEHLREAMKSVVIWWK